MGPIFMLHYYFAKSLAIGINFLHVVLIQDVFISLLTQMTCDMSCFVSLYSLYLTLAALYLPYPPSIIPTLVIITHGNVTLVVDTQVMVNETLRAGKVT